MDVTFNLSDVRFNIYLQIYMKKLSISTPWKEVKENEYKRISSFRPLPEVTLESIDTDEVPEVDYVEVDEVQSLEEEQSSFESVLKSLNQRRVSEIEEEPTIIIETEPQKPVSFFSDYDFGDEATEDEEPAVEEEPVAQEEPAPQPKFSLDYLFKKPETEKAVSPEIEDTNETEITKTDEPNDDDVDTSIFGDDFGLSEEDEDEEPDYSSEDDETEEDEDDSDDSVDTSAFDDDEDDELEEDEDEDFDYSSESDDESVDLSKFEEDEGEDDEDEEPDYSSEDDFEDEEPESDSSVNTINWGDDGDELEDEELDYSSEDEEPDYSSEDEPVITETSETDIGYLPSVDEVTTEVFNVISIANKVYEYQQPVKHHKPKATTIAKPVVNHPKPKTTVKPPIYDTEPVDDLVTFTRKRVRVSELDLLKIYSKKELEQALREGKVLRKKGIIIFAHA